jgi:hypothetical protein
MTFKIPYLYDIVRKLYRQQATVILGYENVNIRNIGQGEALHGKYKRLKPGSDCAYILGHYRATSTTCTADLRR